KPSSTSIIRRKPMQVTIGLPPELEKTVRQHAARNGQAVSAFVLQLIHRVSTRLHQTVLWRPNRPTRCLALPAAAWLRPRPRNPRVPQGTKGNKGDTLNIL